MSIPTRFTPNRTDAAGLPQPVQVVTGAEGDVTIPAGHGTVFITKATAATDLVLAQPSKDLNGGVLTIVTRTAQAHVITAGSGTFDGTNNTATYAAAIGNTLELRALDGAWTIALGGTTGVTLSDV